MRLASNIVLPVLLAACGTDVRTLSQDSDPGVDGGVKTDGGGNSTVVDARVPPPDGIPSGLAPCDEAPYHSDLTFIQEKVFDVSCLDSCHSGAFPKGHLDLTRGNAHASLVNVVSHHDASYMRVMPNNPSNSMLLVQVGGEPGPELEGFMPWGQPKLCDPLIDAMRRWIAAGAPDN